LALATDYSLTQWRSGGDAIWAIQTNTTHDTIDAAQAGSIIDSQQSWMETTVRGPGTLSFWWKVSSQSGGDVFSFQTNGTTATSISGIVDWQQVNFSLAPGVTVLRWSFNEDASIHSGSNSAWLDQVSYTIPSFSLSSPHIDTSGNFSLTLNGTAGQQLVIQTSTNLTSWTDTSTNTLAGSTGTFTDYGVTKCAFQFYRAVFRNY
jgi:hypothetical protein